MIERKYLAHYIDANFDADDPNYVRLGKHLEQYQEELNPQVDVHQNILGEQYAMHNGYQVSSSAEPFYADYDEPLWERLQEIANTRANGDTCMTTRVEVLFKPDGTCVWAYREDCMVAPQSIGGDTSGVQIPFQVLNFGNRVRGDFNATSKTFTPITVTLDKVTETVAVSGTKTLTATTTPSGGIVDWASSDETVATVEAGVVTGVAIGTATITATYKGVIASCIVTVTAT